MNPLTNMKNIKKLSEQELHRNFKTSWHDQYKDSAWIFIGGLPYELTEGDLICVFSQYGEIVHMNLVRDKDTGKQKGFCFVCYEDQRSTVLAVDNFNGIKILRRTIRVDHVSDYKMPKDNKNVDTETRRLQNEGCGPNVKPPPPLPIPSTELPKFAKEEEAPPDGFRLPPRLPIGLVKTEPDEDSSSKKVKSKKSKKRTKKKKRKNKHKKQNSSIESSSNSSDSSSSSSGEDTDTESDEKESKLKKLNVKDKEEMIIKEERFSEDRHKPDDSYKRNKYEQFNNKIEPQYSRDERNANFRPNQRNFNKFDDRRFDRGQTDQRRNDYRDNDRRFNDRDNERRINFNNDRDRRFGTHERQTDKRRINENERKRFPDRRDSRDMDDMKRHRR